MFQASYRAVLRDWWQRAMCAHRSGSRHDRRRLASLLRRSKQLLVARESSFVKRLSLVCRSFSEGGSFGVNRSAFSLHRSSLPIRRPSLVRFNAGNGVAHGVVLPELWLTAVTWPRSSEARGPDLKDHLDHGER